jgi:putative NADPH-quinone reductase
MNTFIVYYHSEPQSFNGALLREAVAALEQGGHQVRVSDLHDTGFNPASGRHKGNQFKAERCIVHPAAMRRVKSF